MDSHPFNKDYMKMLIKSNKHPQDVKVNCLWSCRLVTTHQYGRIAKQNRTVRLIEYTSFSQATLLQAE